MNLLEAIRSRNKKVSQSLVSSRKYWMRSPSNQLLLAATKEALQKYSQGGKVLDAGAGKMPYRPFLRPHFAEYVSSDFERTNPEIDVVTDIEKMPFKNEEFDFIFCTQVLEHVPHPWVALSEMRRIMRPGGRSLVTVPMLGYIHNAPYDFFRYTHFGLHKMAEDAGFKVLELKPLGGLFCFLSYIWSTILTPFYSIPILGTILIYGNWITFQIPILLDKIISPSAKVFPLNYIMVVEK